MDLQMDEFNIITGALDLSKKTVKEIMTKIDDVFMIEHNAVLDFDTVTTIMESGFTRVPIYEKVFECLGGRCAEDDGGGENEEVDDDGDWG